MKLNDRFQLPLCVLFGLFSSRWGVYNCHGILFRIWSICWWAILEFKWTRVDGNIWCNTHLMRKMIFLQGVYVYRIRIWFFLLWNKLPFPNNSTSCLTCRFLTTYRVRRCYTKALKLVLRFSLLANHSRNYMLPVMRYNYVQWTLLALTANSLSVYYLSVII